MKRVLLLLIILALFVLTACGGNGGEIQVTEPSTTAPGENVSQSAAMKDKPIRLPYSTSDSLHPYQATLAMNRQVASLLYDSLYQADGTYKPQRILATAEEAQTLVLTVSIRKAVFSDGTALTAKDIAASFLLAKKSAEYKERLKNFNSCKAQGEDAAVFTLAQGDPYATACLDFPIIPADNKSNDGLPPVGSGRYIIKEEQGSPVLTPNPRWREKLDYGTERIVLTNITDPDTLSEGVGIGSLSFAVSDLSAGTAKRVSARTTQLPLNNFVYLAFNTNRRAFAEPKLRQAVSLLLNREDLALGAFQGNARPADKPFNPAWYVQENPNVQSQKRDEAQKLIDEAGAAGKQLQQTALTLLVNKDNPTKAECARRIMNALQVGGLKVTLNSLSFEAYKTAAARGTFDLLLGEVKLTNNMDLSTLFSQNGGAHYGIDSAGRAAQSYGEFRRGAVTLEAFLDVFAVEMPFVPLLFRGGLAYYDRSLKADIPAAYDADVYAYVADFRY
ncbi:MAG: ABC transporter substrate-binding protein [Oscillospiraceae bacterium]|jgi:peptide/nickel transport system substrate-binding protein|nr:ABC transporter substrate-binding protein [Oscillospiraceae bacterium]